MRGCTRISTARLSTVPKVLPDMSITSIIKRGQPSDYKSLAIKPDCDNPLDLYRIFSRYRYRTDYNGSLAKSDQRIVNQQAQAIYRDIETAAARVHRDRIKLHVHRDMIKIKCEAAIQKLQTDGGKRGNVAGFSNASRKRMIDLMCQQRHGAPKTFVSLTYADEALFEITEHGEVIRSTNHHDWKNHVEILRKRIERKFEDMRAIWRIELKQRKSGRFAGLIAPHYHLLVWGLSPQTVVDHDGENDVTFAEWMNQQWFDILETGLQKAFDHGTHISPVKSSRHAMFYVSKYVAKTEDEFNDQYEVGRRWGRIGQFQTFTTQVITLTEDELIQFRRLLRSWLKSHGRDYAKRLRGSRLEVGFSVYGIGDGFQLDGIKATMPLPIKLLAHAKLLAHEHSRCDSSPV